MTNNKEEIDRRAWQETLQALTAEHGGDLATVEVAGVDVGDQFAAEQVPFSYVEYDPHDDAAIPSCFATWSSTRRTFSFMPPKWSRSRSKSVPPTVP